LDFATHYPKLLKKLAMETGLKLIAALKVDNTLSPTYPYYDTAVAAGFPSPAADYIEERIDLNQLLVKTPSATFFVKVEGESMIDAYIPPKALLVVDRSLDPLNGDIIVAVINGEFTVKRLLKTQAGLFLTPENKKYKPMRIEDNMDFMVWGVVTKIIIDPKAY
jgi:DNA polymerase V